MKKAKQKKEVLKKKPLSDKELATLMDERLQKEFQTFKDKSPAPLSKKEEEAIRRRNQDGWGN